MSIGIELRHVGGSCALSASPALCEKVHSASIEHELLARALDGDGRAFATLVEPHLPMLYRIAARALRKGIWPLLLAAVVSMAMPGLAYARGGPDHDAGQKRAVIEQRLKQLRHELLRKEVGLDEAKALVVERTLRSTWRKVES